jgi:hypothetical protein
MNEEIGKAAGAVWKALEANAPMSPTKLKKATGLKDNLLYMGLGWLAREEKVEFEQKGNSKTVRLK